VEVDFVDASDSRDDDDGVDSEVQNAVDAEADGEMAQDPAKVAHDEATIRGVRAQAIASAKERRITMTAREEKEALGLFPKVPLRFN
jgi:hypothetical protein